MYLPGQEIVCKIDGKYVTMSGMMRDVVTSEWSQGTELYSTQPVPGEWTDEEPTEGVTFTGTVIESDAEVGSIFVFPCVPNTKPDEGIVHGIDTSQWPQGTKLYVSQSTPGELTDEELTEAGSIYIQPDGVK